MLAFGKQSLAFTKSVILEIRLSESIDSLKESKPFPPANQRDGIIIEIYSGQ